MSLMLALGPIHTDFGLQVLAYGFVMTTAVTVSTCAAVGSHVFVVILVEVVHAFSPLIDNSMTTILTIILVQELTVSPLNAFILRRHICWPLVAVAGAVWMGAEACGYEVMDRTDTAVLKRILGLCLVLVLVLQHVWPLVRLHCKDFFGVKEGQADEGKSDPDVRLSEAEAQHEDGRESISTEPQCSEFALRTRSEWFLAIYLGLGGGFLRGLCGAPILFLVSFVLWSGIPKDQWRSSHPALTCLGMPVRIYYFFVVKERYDPARWPQILGALLGCAAGLLVGHTLSTKVNQSDFLDFINFVVVVGAMLLLTNGFKVSIPLAIVTALCWLVAYAIIRVRLRAPASEPERTSLASPGCKLSARSYSTLQ